MDNYKRLNIILGWIIFLIATIVYFLTIEPTTSWWDCGEYIATAYKLQVGHPPGAPLFQMLGRFFSLFAFGDTSRVALMINGMSALSSSLTIMFLFWTISYLAKKIVLRGGEMNQSKMYAVLGSGVVGALAYTFSDSFWFSAVEGEVYAMSSLFTAVVFWAILRWEDEKDEKHATKWIILIAYLMGLSIGVHLLNLLAIPAIAFIFYFKKYKASLKGVIITAAASIILLALIMNGIIPWIVQLSKFFELTFVNSFGLPFNVGTIFYFVLLISSLSWGLYYTQKKQKFIGNTILLCLTFILVGYSSFFMIVIRSNANPPIDENNPEDAISLIGYLGREQYGSWPIFKGQYYNAPIVGFKDGKAVYIKDEKKGKYVITDDGKDEQYVYDPRFTTIFPRMWSGREGSHVNIYKEYGKVKGVPIEVENPDGTTEVLAKPTFGENLRFFFTYQLNHMYFRYFMWNFAGRQNDIESQGGYEHGNWITGISFIDENILGLGPQSDLPSSMKNPAHNKFFLLPFLLGLIGFLYHFNKNKEHTLVIATLFIMTGLAIVVYLNQYPNQPRERDYAYAGSFYAFAIWIGLGVLAIYDSVSKYMNLKIVAVGVTAITLFLVPGIMAQQGWDDHDRSGKYAALDWAKNYLNSCEPNAIIITNGDNDTFPLWYAQEVEGIRKDVRVCNFMLASGHWYIHQMMTKMYDSDPLPFTLTYDQYENGVNKAIVHVDYRDRLNIKGYLDLRTMIDIVASEAQGTKVKYGDDVMSIFPSKKVKLTVDSAAVLKNGCVPEYMADRIEKEVHWKIKKNFIYKNELMLLDLLATNNWERPIYFVSPYSVEKFLDVADYCHLEGFAYKLMPVKAEHAFSGMGGVNRERSYEIMMQSHFGRLNSPDVTIDRESARNSPMPKQNFIRVAEAFISKGDFQKGVDIIDHFIEEFPNEKFPYDRFMISVANLLYEAGEPEKANDMAYKILFRYEEDLDFYNRLNDRLFKYYQSDISDAMTNIQTISMMARENDQKKLSDEVDSVFTRQLELLEL